MKHFDFPQMFRALYDKAVAAYAEGKRGANTFFTPEEKAFLAANGITPQHVYDYAEDHNGYDGEPGFAHALAIELVRTALLSWKRTAARPLTLFAASAQALGR